jgi:hypothetical protein
MTGNDPLRVGFIVEGITDEETLPVLVEELLQQPVESVLIRKESGGLGDFKRPRRGRGLDLDRHWGMLRSYIIALLIEGVDAVVIVVDNDSDAPTFKRWCLLAANLPYYYNQAPNQLIEAWSLFIRLPSRKP